MRHGMVFLTLLSWLWLSMSAALAQGYAVGPNDILRLRAVVLNAADGTIEDLAVVSGSVPVDADGRIAVTLAGSLDVAGLSVEQIADEIETRLADSLSVSRAPRVAVDVERYAPVFLTGEVAQTGAFEFTPGLTVLKAVALAGGPAEIRPLEGEERNFLNARGTLNMLREEVMYLQGRQARLQAERDGTDRIAAPEPVLKAEQAILTARNARYAQEVAARDRALAALAAALSVLEDKLAGNLAQLERARAEVAREENLAERGLIPASKAFERVRYVSDLESRVLDIERSILLARQDLQEEERARQALDTTRAEEVATELQQVTTAIAEARARILTQSSLMAEAAGGITPDRDAALNPLAVTMAYRITRERGTGGVIEGGRATVLMPGDVLEVVFLTARPDRPSN